MRTPTVLILLSALLLQGCDLVHVITPVEMTHTAIGETFVRIDLYMKKEKHIPKSFADLPVRSGYANSTKDGWNRELDYSISEEGVLSLTSLGADGKLGGIGENQDITKRFKTKDEFGKSLIGNEFWLVTCELKE